MANTQNTFTIFNWVSILIITLLLVVLSFICSISINNFNVFASSGAIMAISGIYLSFSHTILLSSKDENKLMAHKNGIGLFGCDKDSVEYEKGLASAKQTLMNERVGFGMSIIGTLIWAYGGYLS